MRKLLITFVLEKIQQMKKLFLFILSLLPIYALAQPFSDNRGDQITLKNALQPFQQKQDSLVQAFKQAPEALQSTEEYQRSMQDQMDALIQSQIDICAKFIRTFPHSRTSLMALTMIVQQHDYLPVADSLYQKLTPELQNTELGQEIGDFIQKYRTTSVGAVAEDFTLNNAQGKPVKLSDFRGKYVLVDFWASCCKHCRQENPNVVEVYNLYKDKNFTVLGVSLDVNKNAWLNAVENDRLTWTQVLDVQAKDNSSVANQYGITQIPCNFLLDPQGKIIAKDLRGGGLRAVLAQLFD
jgi:peroxiredoxin